MSQWTEEEIPEQHWMYRLAKRFFYHDFGVYGTQPLVHPEAKSAVN